MLQERGLTYPRLTAHHKRAASPLAGLGKKRLEPGALLRPPKEHEAILRSALASGSAESTWPGDGSPEASARPTRSSAGGTRSTVRAGNGRGGAVESRCP